MAPETITHSIRSTWDAASADAGGGVPLLTLVLAGALRVRRDGEEVSGPTGGAG